MCLAYMLTKMSSTSAMWEGSVRGTVGQSSGRSRKLMDVSLAKDRIANKG